MMKNTASILAYGLFVAMLAMPAHSRVIEGFEFPEVIPANSDHPELRLNGAAIRNYYYMVDTYVGLMYLENPGPIAETIVNDDGYKRMIYHILMKRVSGRRIAKALYEAMQLNVSREEAELLDERLHQLVKMFDTKMVKGDAGVLDYIPGKGTQVTISGKVKGIIPGKDFYDALMKIWVGEHPVSQAFKEDILDYQQEVIAGE